MSKTTINKVIILARLETGNEITVSVKACDKALSNTDKNVLMKRFGQDIVPSLEDVLYFTIRTTIDGKKDNWKLDTVQEVGDTVDDIFRGLKG